MSTATLHPEQTRPQLRAIWLASQERQRSDITADALAHQLAFIDGRIRKAQIHAATSNRARGAVRAWTQKREALIGRVAEEAHPAHAGDAASEQAERLLLAGAPEHLRVAESQARLAVERASRRLQELDPDSLPADFKAAREVVATAKATHAQALRAAIDWE